MPDRRCTGHLIARRVLHMDGSAQPMFVLGGIVSNNVLPGMPLTTITLGEASIPSCHWCGCSTR